MAKRFYDSDPRRAQERKDFGMISEDHSAMANLPQNVVMREYSGNSHNFDADINDTIRGVDGQISSDIGKANANKKPHKF